MITDNQSISRNIFPDLRKVLGQYPLVALTGPRQSGKTTLLKTMLPEFRYVSLEDKDTRAFALEDTRGFFKAYDHQVILDEVQRAPELFSYLQGVVDSSRVMGRYILSGSQNFDLMANITQSLAGRISIFKLFPFDFIEMQQSGLLSDDLSEVMTRGFYPAIYDRDIDPDRYYADYVTTYVERDLTQLVNVQNKRVFKNFIRLCAARAGQLINYNDLARDAGISHTTAYNWLSILETSYITYMLEPNHKNYSKRVIKSPKLYFYDTGLLCHLLNIRKGKLTPQSPLWGHLFENMIVSELVKQNYHFNKLRDYRFWRDTNGNEVDLLYQHNESQVVYEIKSSQTLQSKALKQLSKYSALSTDEIAGQKLIYTGEDVYVRSGVDITPWQQVQ